MQAMKAPSGVHLPKIIAASAIYPRPLVMPTSNEVTTPMQRNAPASAEKNPLVMTAP